MIYTGRYSRSEAGISVAGRGVVMSTNYRNTRKIASFAAQIVEGDQFVDLEGGPGRADAALDARELLWLSDDSPQGHRWQTD